MRFVNRNLVARPASLGEGDTPATREQALARDYYDQLGPGATSEFDFVVYKRPDIGIALRNLFHGKCAYCETYFQASSPAETEHFRPKGRVAGTDHRGYWWLASTWDNLLPACILCNRTHRRRVAHEGMSRDQFEAANPTRVGKLDHFPVAGDFRACSPDDDHAREDALLIDPTTRDPGNHINWVVCLDLSLAAPTNTARNPDPHGEETIRILGLNREGLVDERTLAILDMRALGVNLKTLISETLKLPAPQRAGLLTVIDGQIRSLKSHTHPDRPYSAAAISCFAELMTDLVDELRALRTDEGI